MLTPLELNDMSIEDKLDLMELLWDSMAADPKYATLTSAQRDELESRLADLEANPEGGSSWQEVRQRIEQQLN